MKNNNSGFTLVELIVCILIFSIVLGAAFGFMLSGTKSYGMISARLDLQVQSQLTMNQMNNYIIDCNSGICFADNNTLYVLNKEADDSYVVNVFRYDAINKSIYYGKGSAQAVNAETFECSYTADELLSENITDFNVELKGSGGKASSAVLMMGFARLSASNHFERIIALRNKPAIVSVTLGT